MVSKQAGKHGKVVAFQFEGSKGGPGMPETTGMARRVVTIQAILLADVTEKGPPWTVIESVLTADLSTSYNLRGMTG